MCKVHHLLRTCGWSVWGSFGCVYEELELERRALVTDASPAAGHPL